MSVSLIAGHPFALKNSHGAEDTTAAAAGFVSYVPPNFNTLNYDNMANTFTDCMNLKASLGGQCKPVDIPDTGKMDCKKNRDTSRFERDAKDAKKYLDCRKGKFDALKSEVSCLQKQATILDSQMGTLAQGFQQNYERMQTDLGQMKQISEDRQKQLEFVDGRLNGTSATDPGLKNLKDEALAMTAAMGSEILDIQNNQEQQFNQEKTFDESIKIRTMGLTTSCFVDERQEKWACARGGEPVSAAEGVICRYEQNRTLNSNNVSDKGLARTAKEDADRLRALLGRIFSNAPMDANLPRNAEESLTFSAQGTTLLTPEAIERNFGKELKAFDSKEKAAKGLGVYRFVMGEFARCYRQSVKKVDKEKKMASSALGQQAFAIRTAKQATKTKAADLLGKYAQKFGDMMRGLTGMHLPLNTSACTDGSPKTQLGCLKDVKKNMEALSTGTSPNSEMKILIPSTYVNPLSRKANVIEFKCQGLDGCITAYNNVKRNLDKEVRRIEGEKGKYIQVANTSMTAYSSGRARTLSMQ
ncbi:MAG: hypothetical protein AAB425_04055, partial [Bdellovibrionota bacterium]